VCSLLALARGGAEEGLAKLTLGLGALVGPQLHTERTLEYVENHYHGFFVKYTVIVCTWLRFFKNDCEYDATIVGNETTSETATRI
jgi:hypothetical protein